MILERNCLVDKKEDCSTAQDLKKKPFVPMVDLNVLGTKSNPHDEGAVQTSDPSESDQIE